jgi:hypothetical protein
VGIEKTPPARSRKPGKEHPRKKSDKNQNQDMENQLV